MDSSSVPRISRLALPLALLLCLAAGIVAIPARAAGITASRPAVHPPAHPLTAAPVTAALMAASVEKQTGETPSQLSTQSACDKSTASRVECLAQVLVSARTHDPVEPRVERASSPAKLQAPTGAPLSATADAPPPAEPIATPPPDPGTPAFLQQAYDLGFLSATDGVGDTIAIVDSYDDPNAASDMATFRSTFGLPACGTANNCFTKLNQSGQASGYPSTDPTGGWEVEESLDLDAVSALCPLCHIVLVEANSTSLSDVQVAAQTAATTGANQISMSLGGVSTSEPPGPWTFSGISTLAATGDTGYDGPGQVSFPAGDPGVTAVGGTDLAAANNPRGFAESAWEDAGSGCDPSITKPSYQAGTGTCSGRSTADVSAIAGGAGLDVYDSTPYQGASGWFAVGGTSLATPLTAAFDALTGIDSTHRPSWTYVHANLLNDIVSGNNDTSSGDTGGMCAAAIAYICNAGPGYDGPTGNGSISGDVITGAPGIGGTYSSSVADTAAQVAGGVYPNSEDTTYHWEYGTTTSYGQQTSAQDIGSGASLVAVQSTLSGLTPGTTYHYRLVASNTTGTEYGYDETLTTATTPVNTSPPTISTSTPQVGVPIQAQPGTWNPSGTISYQWQDCTTSTGSSCTNIAGATSSSYTPTSSDVGLFPLVEVTESNSGSSTADSATVGPIAPAPPANTSPPTISTSTPEVGVAIQAQPGTWSPSGTISYQWQDCTTSGGGTCPNIAGATSISYTPTSSDVGRFPRVAVTESNSSGSSTATSATVGPIAAPPPPTTTTTTSTPPPTTTTTPPPPLVPKVGHPTITSVSLTGVALGKPKLKLTVLAGSNAPALKAISIALPSGLKFSKQLKRGVSAPAGFKDRLQAGSLMLSLRSPVRRVTITLTGPALTSSAALATKARRHTLGKLRLAIGTTNTSNTRFTAVAKVSDRG